MKFFITLLMLSSAFISQTGHAKVNNIWPRIPFNIIGANLCEFRAAYSQTRSQYMKEMVSMAEKLLKAGDLDPVDTLMNFNRMYEENLRYARRGLGITLENTFKGYLEEYYRNIKPRVRNLEFKHVIPIDEVINMAIRGGQVPYISQSDIDKLDLMAYGSYSMSPNCNGNVIVTLNVIDKNGISRSYNGAGRPSTVMSQIASRFFEDYQRTKFPSKIRIGSKTLTLLGGFNGDIDRTSYLDQAEKMCETLGGRLPTAQEYKFINSYGSWSGGITLGHNVWAMKFPYVFVPYFENAPQRTHSQVNASEFLYTCVR